MNPPMMISATILPLLVNQHLIHHPQRDGTRYQDKHTDQRHHYKRHHHYEETDDEIRLRHTHALLLISDYLRQSPLRHMNYESVCRNYVLDLPA